MGFNSSDTSKIMKSMSVCIIALILLAPSAVLAVGKYDPEKICLKEKDNSLACDLLIEQAVAKDLPGVIERKGNVLSIRLRNGKTVKRKNATDPDGTASDGESFHEMSACNYLPDSGYLEICHIGWEWIRVEFVNIKSGASVSYDGLPVYSPSGRRALMVEVNDDGGGFNRIEIWRFDKKRPVKEFQMEKSSEEESVDSSWSNLSWLDAVWKSETEILVNGSPDSPPSPYSLVKKGRKWILKKK